MCVLVSKTERGAGRREDQTEGGGERTDFVPEPLDPSSLDCPSDGQDRPGTGGVVVATRSASRAEGTSRLLSKPIEVVQVSARVCDLKRGIGEGVRWSGKEGEGVKKDSHIIMTADDHPILRVTDNVVFANDVGSKPNEEGNECAVCACMFDGFLYVGCCEDGSGGEGVAGEDRACERIERG